MRRTSLAVTIGAVVALTATSCGDTTEPASNGDEATADQESLVLYSGRNEELIQPLIDTFSEDTGIEVEVRYGDTAELAAQLLEEGDGSPADVFLAQDAGALGAVAEEGLFDELEAELLEQVPEAYRDSEDQWVGVSGRARTLIYNTDAVDEADLPESVDELTQPEYAGRVGVAPTNASFQSFVTAHRELEGEEATQSFLDDLAANDPQIREGNGEIVTDVAGGVIDMGLVNHYYLYGRAKELGEDPAEMNVANHLFSGGDVGSLVNVAGVGVLNSENASAVSLAEFMLSTEGQTYFAEETAEYPMLEGVDGPEGMPSLAELDAPDIDLNRLDDLETSVEMIVESGLVG